MPIFEQDGFTLIDVSHKVEDGMLTYKGLPAPIICDYLTREASKSHYAEGTSFQIGVVTLCSNTGTYVDVPFHRYQDGEDLSEVSLAKLANLDAVKVTLEEGVQKITSEHLQGFEIAGKAVLFETNWSRHWGTDQYFENHPYVTEETAILLRDKGAVFVGIDSYNIDDLSRDTRPCHSTLLKAGIPICEHMAYLSELPDNGFRFFAVPVKMKGMGTFPVRAFGLVKN